MTTEPSQYFKGRTVQEQMTEVIGYVDTRAAEVAVDAIASDVAQVHQDMLDADADASAAAASAAAAAGTLANAVKKTGESSQSIAGDVAVGGNLTGNTVTGNTVTAPTPTNNTDAANKKYVDDADALKLNITDVNQYAVGLTGNQSKTGVIRYPFSGANSANGGRQTEARTGEVLAEGFDYSQATNLSKFFPIVGIEDENNVPLARMYATLTDTQIIIGIQMIPFDGSSKTKVLATLDRSTGVIS